ncbi:unnamed protein product [Durusdinium trenchii]|uniref:Uncharacterized protein n=2 Tax=Durusdinium trenchii TaxID=1381693 RepID=A0ABP0JXK2_9DINO
MAQDSAIEYLLALQARPRPRRIVCCYPGAFALCQSPEKCTCAEVMTCATDIDASFSSQGSDSDSVEATPGRVVHEAHMQARPPRFTQPRISVIQVPLQGMQHVQARTSIVQGPATPRSQALGKDAGLKVSASTPKVPVAMPVAATVSYRRLPQAWDLGSPCSSTQSAPVLPEARSLAALPARWNSAATTLTGSQRAQVKVTSKATTSTASPVQTPRSSQVVLASSTDKSYHPPLPDDAQAESLRRSRSWQPQAASLVPTSLPVLLPMRYTFGSASCAKRPPMAQVVA